MSAFAELSTVRTAYETSGAGLPIVLVHGAESDMGSLLSLQEALKASAKVVRYDQRGCGCSADTGTVHSILDLAQDAVDLMGALGHSKFSVFGTSLGGRIAQAIAAQHPESVDRLVLCNTWPLSEQLSELNPAGFLKLQVLRRGLPATAHELAEIFYTPALASAQPELAARYAKWPPDSPRAALALEVHAYEPGAIRCPTLLLSGTDDALVPSWVMRKLADGIPGARFIAMPGIGHAAAAQAPTEVARHIAAFLST